MVLNQQEYLLTKTKGLVKDLVYRKKNRKNNEHNKQTKHAFPTTTTTTNELIN